MKVLALFSSLLAVPVQASPARPVTVAAPRPVVEVAFVLDTTGSMGGLLEGAKRKIWSIAERIGDGRPRPELRIALVAYRDRGDEYVTRVHDFTGDMDAVHETLRSLRAEGGGDAPEHVSAALHDAVHRLSWSNGRSLKMIFLVGDAPPHVDYQDGFDYRRHAAEAHGKGIVVEAIECGTDPATARYWQEIAGLAGGHYAQIDAEGGMTPTVTPVDAELGRLNGELAGTVVAAGSASERRETARRLSTRAAMAPAAAAEAAGYFAKADRLADKDVVGLTPAEQKKEIDALRRSADAPPQLRGKTEAEALAFVAAQTERRARIQSRIVALEKQRNAFLRQEAGRHGQAAPAGFDAQVVGLLREAAAQFGIAY